MFHDYISLTFLKGGSLEATAALNSLVWRCTLYIGT